MWENAVRFLSLQDANVRYVVLGSMLLAGATGVLGCFAFLRKRSLVGDAIAHAALPGVCLAYLFTDSKEPVVLLAGAALSGWVGTFFIDRIRGLTPLKEDAAIAIVLTVFFGLGISLLTAIQSMGRASQAGLDKFLFGQAASLMSRDVYVLGALAVFLCVAVLFSFKELQILCFDPEFARSMGLPVRTLEFILTALVVIAIAVGLQMVGVVLMAALLITPAAAARQWTDSLPKMVFLAGGIGALSGFAGAFASSLAPRMPTGPWMVVTVSVVFGLSLLLAPRRGLLSRWLLRLQTRSTVAAEHVLTTLYRNAELEGRFLRPMPTDDILRYRPMTFQRVLAVLRSLKAEGMVAQTRTGWTLTEKGLAGARKTLRRHRLWELYLAQELNLPPDKVHHNADEVEHWLTEAQEEELEAILAHPSKDPHSHAIPSREVS